MMIYDTLSGSQAISSFMTHMELTRVLRKTVDITLMLQAKGYVVNLFLKPLQSISIAVFKDRCINNIVNYRRYRH